MAKKKLLFDWGKHYKTDRKTVKKRLHNLEIDESELNSKIKRIERNQKRFHPTTLRYKQIEKRLDDLYWDLDGVQQDIYDWEHYYNERYN